MQQFIAQTLNGLTLAGIIFLVSSGFTLVFGVMRVTNLSHGAVYLLGGYIGYSVITATHNFLYGLAAAAIGMGLFGLLLERTLITWLKGNEMSELLATLGLIYVIDDVSPGDLGRQPADHQPAGSPRWLVHAADQRHRLPERPDLHLGRIDRHRAGPVPACSAGPGSGPSSGRAWTTARW